MHSYKNLLLLAAFLLPIASYAQVTETTDTSGAGHVDVRMDALSLGLNQEAAAPNQYQALAAGTTIVSAGLTDNFDFQVGSQLFLRTTFSASNIDHTETGMGNVSTRFKWTFWKDEATGQALAVIPYVEFPTHSQFGGSQYLQGGLIIPWSMKIGLGSTAAAMIEWDQLRNTQNTAYVSRFYSSSYLRWDLGKTFGAYTEATLSDSTGGSSSFTGTLGAGATLSISHNFEWDFEESKVIGNSRSAWTEVLRFRWKLL
jgi:hypothetical protein